MACAGIRTAAACTLTSIALAVALGSGLPVVAAEATIDGREGVPDGALLAQADSGWENLHRDDAATAALQTAAATMPQDSPREAGTFESIGTSHLQMAQFQLPPPEAAEKALAMQLPTHLSYQYAYGSESDIVYRRDRDLNKNLRDNSTIATPQLNGIVVYRPTAWLESTLEMLLEKEFPLQEEDRVTLPNGDIVFAQKRRTSFLVDQGFVKIHNVTAPFELIAGRRNYEDERHWLYDQSLDIASIGLKQGYFRVDATGGREVRWDWEFAPHNDQVKSRSNIYMLYADYRGIEGIKLAGYMIRRDDLAHIDGRPRHVGARALGMPSENLNYWAELAYLRGTDEFAKKFSAYGYDVGFTYRFTGVLFSPNVTLSYAFGTGDNNPNDDRNREFRQTGMQSNEMRFAGFSKFKYYGEALDPELSNLQISTVGFGFRPALNVSVDLVYHTYRFDKIAESVRNGALTAEMNQVDTRLSRDVGSEFDIVVGFRRLFGLRRLGLDLRAGCFYPGTAFLRNDGTDARPNIRKADNALSVVAKLWW